MAHKFKAPVEFFLSDALPLRCLITGRTEHLSFFDVPLPYVRFGLAHTALLVYPPPPGRIPGPAAVGQLPSHVRSAGVFVWSLGTWLAGLGWYFGVPWGWRAALISMGVWLAVVLVWQVGILPGLRRRTAAKAVPFVFPLARPSRGEFRIHRILQVTRLLTRLAYWVALGAIWMPALLGPFAATHPWAFWIAFLVDFSVFTSITRRTTLLAFKAKERVLEIRFPDRNKELFEEYCRRFMQWRATTGFQTAIRYTVEEFPDLADGGWDSAREKNQTDGSDLKQSW